MRQYFIGVYEENGAETLAHVVETITEAAEWLGVSIDALYKAKHLHGVMRAKGYTLELIENTEELDNA